MAEVKVPMSEWKLMEEKGVLLEKALEREITQSKKIENLQKENIKTLKLNEKRVTTIRRTDTQEMICSQRDVYSIMRDLERYFKGGHRDQFLIGGFNHPDPRESYQVVEHIQKLFFTKKVINIVGDDEVSYVGLGEIKAEIAKEYEDSMSKEYKEQIVHAEDLITENETLRRNAKEDKLLKKDSGLVIRGLEKDVKLLMGNVKKAHDEAKRDLAQMADETVPKTIVDRTRNILKKHFGFNANARTVKDLRELWKSKE